MQWLRSSRVIDEEPHAILLFSPACKDTAQQMVMEDPAHLKLGAFYHLLIEL